MTEKVKPVIGYYFLLPDFKSRGHPSYECPKSNSVLSEEDYAAYQAVLSRMGTRYSTAKVPDMNDPNKMLELEPDLTALMYSGATEATQARFLRSHFLIGC